MGEQTKGLISKRVGKRGTPGLTRVPLGMQLLCRPILGQRRCQYTGPPYILGKPDICGRLVRGAVALARRTWTNPSDVVKALAATLNGELKQLGVMLPLKLTTFTVADSPGLATGAAFDPSTWQINAKLEQLPSRPSSAPQKLAEQFAHLAHEYEHLVDYYYALRYMLTEKKSDREIKTDLKISSKVVSDAKRHPTLKSGSVIYAQAEEFYWFIRLRDSMKTVRTSGGKLVRLSELAEQLQVEVLDVQLKIEETKKYGRVRSIDDMLGNASTPRPSRLQTKELLNKYKRRLTALKKKHSAVLKQYKALPNEVSAYLVQEKVKEEVERALSR